jgi:hypothetical protein
MTAITPYFVQLVYDAALKSFWRKARLTQFLRQCRVSETFLNSWAPEETKRDFLDRLFSRLQASQSGQAALLKMAHFLAEQKSFPDLEKWEDSADKIRDAKAAVAALADFLRRDDECTATEKQQKEARKAFAAKQETVLRSQQDLGKLSDRLNELATRLGTQGAGYKFQEWFYDLLTYAEIESRRPYVHSGRQIDGSLTVSGTTYLVELKFTRDQADATDIDSFHKKVTGKADNTMGVMVSMSGYSTVAIQEASGPRTPLLLLDHSHLYLCLSGGMSLTDIINRVRRHASQTGEAYLPPTEFGAE